MARLAGRWQLTVREARAGNTGRTLLCDSPGGPRVLKLCPDPAITAAEATALHAWAGLARVVPVLDADLGEGAILLERLVPGTVPSGTDVAWNQVRELLADLRSVPAPRTTPTQLERVHEMFDLAERRLRGSPASAHLPWSALRTGRRRATVLATTGPITLVHGDLHPGNVLDAGPGRGLVAIDPRPCAGDPAFDAVDWAFLPLAAGGTLGDGLARLPDPARTRAWCVALAPLVAMGPLRRTGPTPFTDAVLRLTESRPPRP